MKEKVVYCCSACGYQTAKWVGQCPSCKQWNTMEEKTQSSYKKGPLPLNNSQKPKVEQLKNVVASKSGRILTGIGEFDRVMGGGIVKDSLTILSSPPGGGKSTLTLTISNELAKQGYVVLYASGEESESQIKNRAERILEQIQENIWILSDVSMDQVLAAIEDLDPDFIVIDSIQTFSLQEYYPARAGNPTQTMECASALLQVAKNGARPRAVMMIGQMNKNDELAGLRSLEHLVDTVLIMEGEGKEELRSIAATKNRFGSTGEMGFFSMTEKGLVSINNPSEYFVTKRDKNDLVSGSAITVIREGARPIITEIESLVSNSYTPYPSRIGEALKREQLNTLISILEQRGKINLFDKNVVIKATGGIRLSEQSVNLAVIMSIASSVYDVPIPADTAFIADVGLTGELKKVPALESRIRELDRMGFCRVYVPKGGNKSQYTNIQVLELKTVSDVIQHVLGKSKKTYNGYKINS